MTKYKILIVTLACIQTMLIADHGGFGAGFGTGLAVGTVGTALATRPVVVEYPEDNYYADYNDNRNLDDEVAQLREENRRLRRQQNNIYRQPVSARDN